MKNILTILFISIIASSCQVRINYHFSLPEAITDVPAFPGAEGAGSYTTGGRGGKVLFVTRLEDDEEEGSFRWAVNQDFPRMILFKVSGIIELSRKLNIANGNVTIAGQSAPGDGICISGNSVEIKSDNVIIRFLRFRLGDKYKVEDDAIWGRGRENIIIDHCSMSWSTDECASFYDNKNFTMQWCILSESLNASLHFKGNHGFGAIWGGQMASFHHNLIANHNSRNPRFCGSRFSGKPELEFVDFRNNVIYNWGYNSGYAAEGGCYNIVNNYYKYGPATNNNVKSRIFEPYSKNDVFGKFYVDGNYVFENAENTIDNWKAINPHGKLKDRKSELKSDTSFIIHNIRTQTAENAYDKVLLYAGSSYRRDITDNRIASEVRSGNNYFKGSKTGIVGIIDSQQDVGGWPQYKTYDIKIDSDNDGIPDYWENNHGLNKNNGNDSNKRNLDKKGYYTNLEVYLNSIVDNIISSQY